MSSLATAETLGDGRPAPVAPPVVLASASPSRAAVLRHAGVPVVIEPARIDEGEPPCEGRSRARFGRQLQGLQGAGSEQGGHGKAAAGILQGDLGAQPVDGKTAQQVGQPRSAPIPGWITK